MKKALTALIFASIFMVGCSNVSNEVEKSSKNLVSDLFDSLNSIETYENGLEMSSLNQFFTSDSEVSQTLVEYLTISQSNEHNMLVNNLVDKIKIEKFEDMYLLEVDYAIVSKETENILTDRSLNLYLKDENGQLKIQTADYGG